jgi:hypothetical protein
MWFVLAGLLFLFILWAAQFATPAQKVENRKRIHRLSFWLWLLSGPIATWMAWDAGGPVWSIFMLGVTAFALVDSCRKGWG